MIGGATLISVSRVLQQGVGFLLLPLYTRILTPEDYGRIEVLMVSVLFSLMVLGQGLPPSLLRQLTYVHRENEERRRVVAGSALAYLVLSSVVFVAFAALISSDMAGLFFGDSEYSYVVLIGALLVGLQGVTALGSAVLLARQRVLVVVVVGFIQFGTKLFLNIYLVMFLKLGFVGIIWGHLAGDIVGALAFCWAMRRHIEWQWRRLDVVELRALLRYGLPLIASSLSLQVLFLSDRYVIRYLRPSAELGLYAVAAKFATAFFFILVEPFDRMWEVSSLEVLGRPNGRQHIARVANAFLVAGTSACLLAIVVAEPLVGLAAAPAFGAAHAAVGLLMAGALLCGLGEVFRVGLRAAGASGTMAAIAAGAAVFNVVVTIKLVPRLGFMGAAIATVLAFLLYASASLVVSQERLRIPYDGRRMIPAVVVLLGACLAQPGLLLLDDATRLAVNAIVALLFFAASPWLIDPETRRAVVGGVESAVSSLQGRATKTFGWGGDRA